MEGGRGPPGWLWRWGVLRGGREGTTGVRAECRRSFARLPGGQCCSLRLERQALELLPCICAPALESSPWNAASKSNPWNAAS
eukprot:1158552-Pelagomonas_calceolata.AAC.1